MIYQQATVSEPRIPGFSRGECQKDNFGVLYNNDCMKVMPQLGGASIDLTITDIPYNFINRTTNGIRNLNKSKADVLTFDLLDFVKQVDRITKGTIIIFCGVGQLSTIFDYFNQKQKKKQGTIRQLVWTKSNPSPMNGDYVYLSAVENAIWFRKSKAPFNAHCKPCYFKYSCGKSKLHPTEKNYNLIQELILDNSNEGQVIFDPCAGSGTHLLVAKNTNRRYIGIEIEENYFNIAKERLKNL